MAAGDSFTTVISEKELDEASLMSCDQITVSSNGTCWTIEVHRSDDVSSLWSLAKQRTRDAILIGREAF